MSWYERLLLSEALEAWRVLCVDRYSLSLSKLRMALERHRTALYS